ncbi:hypothetical protein PIB30_060845 [Stylosanthes scabra]|uniref:Uncharacterized protein n=1 Tax=Stylosanthes scabra TaxID=79078 RepID=A0ABU6UJH6_9FABA|nr:hypothetical protein [Stylosanthes scabra]
MESSGSPIKVTHKRQRSQEEQDQLNYSKKKVRKEEGDFSRTQLLVQRQKEWMAENPNNEEAPSKIRTFAQIVQEGPNREDMDEGETDNEDSESEEEEDEEDSEKDEENGEKSKDGIRVDEINKRDYNILISKKKEKKLWKPWKNTLIVKLLGRRVGYAAIKRRLELMWQERGSTDVIDLKENKSWWRKTRKALELGWLCKNGGEGLEVKRMKLTTMKLKRANIKKETKPEYIQI